MNVYHYRVNTSISTECSSCILVLQQDMFDPHQSIALASKRFELIFLMFLHVQENISFCCGILTTFHTVFVIDCFSYLYFRAVRFGYNWCFGSRYNINTASPRNLNIVIKKYGRNTRLQQTKLYFPLDIIKVL